MYALQQALLAIRKNWIASVSTITTMTLSLTVLAGFSLLSLNLNQVLASLQGELEMSAYLGPDANAPLLLRTVDAWPEVARVDLVSPEEALQLVVTDCPRWGRRRRSWTTRCPKLWSCGS